MAKIISWNIQRKLNTQAEDIFKIHRFLSNLTPDYLLFQEVTAASYGKFSQIAKELEQNYTQVGISQTGNVTKVLLARSVNNPSYTRWDLGSLEVKEITRGVMNMTRIKSQLLFGDQGAVDYLLFDVHAKSGGDHHTAVDLDQHFARAHFMGAKYKAECILVGDMNIECPIINIDGIEVLGKKKTTGHGRTYTWEPVAPGVKYTHLGPDNNPRVLDFLWTTHRGNGNVIAETGLNQAIHNYWNENKLWTMFDHQPVVYQANTEIQFGMNRFVQGETMTGDFMKFY